MARLLLVRHGESTWNAEQRWQGWADPPLSATGERQARDAAGALTGLGLRSVVASDLQRARRTAELLTEALGLGVVAVVPALRERDVGRWSGLTRSEIDRRWPGQIAAWRRGERAAPPGGERNDDFTDRVAGAVRDVAARPEATAGPLLVVTHGGVIRALERHAGVEARTQPNLGGRWFEVDGHAVVAGPAIGLTDPDGPVAAPVF